MSDNMSNDTEQQQLWTVEDEIEASIKPCPKCGGKAVIEKFDEVVCLECGLWSGDEWESLEYAVDWWNKQPLIDDLRAQVAALTAELETASRVSTSWLSRASVLSATWMRRES